MTSRLLKLFELTVTPAHCMRMAVAASDILLKGKESFSIDPATLTPEQKKNLITRNLQVSGREVLTPIHDVLYIGSAWGG